MPYRREGKTIYVKKGGEWKVLKTHPSEEKAKAHFAVMKGVGRKGHK